MAPTHVSLHRFPLLLRLRLRLVWFSPRLLTLQHLLTRINTFHPVSAPRSSSPLSACRALRLSLTFDFINHDISICKTV